MLFAELPSEIQLMILASGDSVKDMFAFASTSRTFHRLWREHHFQISDSVLCNQYQLQYCHEILKTLVYRQFETAPARDAEGALFDTHFVDEKWMYDISGTLSPHFLHLAMIRRFVQQAKEGLQVGWKLLDECHSARHVLDCAHHLTGTYSPVCIFCGSGDIYSHRRKVTNALYFVRLIALSYFDPDRRESYDGLLETMTADQLYIPAVVALEAVEDFRVRSGNGNVIARILGSCNMRQAIHQNDILVCPTVRPEWLDAYQRLSFYWRAARRREDRTEVSAIPRDCGWFCRGDPGWEARLIMRNI